MAGAHIMNDTPIRLGVVMGAGGPFGWPFHLGVLQGLQQSQGLHIRDAGRVIGTSSGAAISAAMLTGRLPDEILATTTAGPDDATKDEVRAALADVYKPWRWLRPQAPSLLRSARRNPVAAGVGMLPAGFFPTAPLRRFVESDTIDWPTPLWIPVVSLDSGDVVVLGRDRTDVALRDAIEATAAVPLMMRPKQLDGVHYVDGAVHSATHANLVNGSDFDLIVVSSPMTRPGRGPVKIRSRRELATDVAALRSGGARVVVIEPDAKIMERAAGYPRSNPGAGRSIADSAAKLTIEAFDR